MIGSLFRESPLGGWKRASEGLMTCYSIILIDLWGLCLMSGGTGERDVSFLRQY
jgi:hypothetical protein